MRIELGGLNGMFTRAVRRLDALAAKGRIETALHKIGKAEKAAAQGDVGVHVIAATSISRGYGNHVSWLELRLNPNDIDDRVKLTRLREVLESGRNLKHPQRVIDAANFLDREIVGANHDNI